MSPTSGPDSPNAAWRTTIRVPWRRDDEEARGRYAALMIDASEQLLRSLRDAHRRLDEELEALRNEPGADQLEIFRLKKRKLRLRDEIARAADAMIPDLLA